MRRAPDPPPSFSFGARAQNALIRAGFALCFACRVTLASNFDHLRAEGLSLDQALVGSDHWRLRPVRMTSLAAAIGRLPLACGIGSGADRFKPLAIAVIGALCISGLL